MPVGDFIGDTTGSPHSPVGGSIGKAGDRSGLRMASAVVFVEELDRSVSFYRELLRFDVTVHDDGAALLVSPHGFQLYLRTMGPSVEHPLGDLGIQYLVWTADGEEDLRRCEQVLQARSTHVRTETLDEVTIVEGRDPDEIPVIITYPGPAQAPRRHILERIYQW
jgi:hypothetical protein